MKKDNSSNFQNGRTLRERNQRQKTIIAHALKHQFKKEFKTSRVQVGDQKFMIDLISEDGKIAVKILKPCLIQHEKICSRKFQQILSATLILRSINAERKLLIFTNKKMYEKFIQSITLMPTPICGTTEGNEIAWIPLFDELDNYEYSEPSTNFRINQNNSRQTGRENIDRN